jgi:hypothetical protein
MMKGQWQTMENEKREHEDALDEEELEQVSGGSGTGAYLITSVTHAADSDKKNAVQVQYDESDLEFIRR